MTKRLTAALAAYAGLAAVACFTLQGNVRYAVLILFGYFALRTFIATKISRNEPPLSDTDSEVEQQDR